MNIRQKPHFTRGKAGSKYLQTSRASGTEWIGGWYYRVKSDSWRDSKTGIVVSNNQAGLATIKRSNENPRKFRKEFTGKKIAEITLEHYSGKPKGERVQKYSAQKIKEIEKHREKKRKIRL